MKTQGDRLSLMPRDLPSTCPDCGTHFRLRRNVQVVPSRRRRFLESGTHIALCVGVSTWILIVMLMVLPIGEFLPCDRSLGFGMMVLLLGPYLLFEMLTSIAPKTRLLTCHACGFTQTCRFKADRR